MSFYRPERAIILCRLSKYDDDDLGSLELQEERARELADRLGWSVWRVTAEQGVSGYKRRRVDLPDGSKGMRVVRPVYREVLADLAARRADGLIALDLDRATRDPRDLEDLIDIIEASSPRIPVTSVTGSLRLDTDADVTMARVMVALANKSSRDTARRVADGRLRQAREGRHGGGRRRFGRELDMTIRADEAAIINTAVDDILAGVSLRQVYRRIADTGIPTAENGRWTQIRVREILLAAHIAGYTSHKGEPVASGAWEPIVTPERWRAVRAVLLASGRRTTEQGPVPRRLGSGLFLAECGGLMGGRPERTRRSGRYDPDQYRCRQDSCVVRGSAEIDDAVLALAGARLAAGDARGLAGQAARVDTSALTREIRSLTVRLDEIVEAFADGEITREQMSRGSARVRAQILERQQMLVQNARVDPLDGLVGERGAEALLRGLDLGRQRAVVAALMTVRIRKVGRGRPPRPRPGERRAPRGLEVSWTPSGPLGPWG